MRLDLQGMMAGKVWRLMGQLKLLENCQHAARLSLDDYGVPTYAPATPFLGLWDQRTRRIRNREGDEVVSMGSVTLLGTPIVAPEDQLTLPDGRQPELIDVRSVRSADGIALQELFF